MPRPQANPNPNPLAHPAVFALAIFSGTVVVALVALIVRDWRESGLENGEGHPNQTARNSSPPPDRLAAYRPREVAGPAPLDAVERRRVAVVSEAARSVVHIQATRDLSVVKDQVRYQGLDPLSVRPGTGSGVIWNRRGYIVTNAHLVDGQTSVTVQLFDGSRWRADYVGAVIAEDLAVLCIGAPPDRLVPVQPGTATDLAVGQSVYALGNPFGLDLSLTVGVVSGLGRETRTPAGAILRDLIQTDAAINPGNSGGPLLDSAGAMIGLNSSIPAQTTTASGIGFAVPIERINQVVPRMILAGIEPLWELGLKLAGDKQSEGLLEHLGVRGVAVLAVDPGGPSDGKVRYLEPSGGTLRLGDVILGVGGQLTPDRQSLARVIGEALRANRDEVELELLRCPAEYTVQRGADGGFESELLRDAPKERITLRLTPVWAGRGAAK